MGRSFRESLYQDRSQSSRREVEDKHQLHRHERRYERRILDEADDDPPAARRRGDQGEGKNTHLD